MRYLLVFSFLLVSCGRPGQVDFQIPEKLNAPVGTPARSAPEKAVGIEREVDDKLFEVWKTETLGKTAAEVSAMNEATFKGLEELPAAEHPKAFSEVDSQSYIAALEENEVTSERYKYEQPDTAIGYCFGRAMFVHLKALKDHYPKPQIKKIWAIGHMSAGGINWAFHVATIIRDGAGEWRVVDSYVGRPMPPKEWAEVFKKQNSEGNLRYYITPAQKFTPSSGRYNRTQLGLDLAREKDWYQHYFKDLMLTLKARKQELQLAI